MDGEKCERNINLNNWYAFEHLPQYLEHKTLQTYEQWKYAYQAELR